MKTPSAVHVILPLAFSAVIYVGLRSVHLRINRLLIDSPFGAAVNALREALTPAANHLPTWILFTLPDALWVYALTSWLISIWSGSESTFKSIWISTGLLSAFMIEWAQATHLLAGTFDVADLFGYMAGFAAALLLATPPSLRPEIPLWQRRASSIAVVASFVILGLGVIDSRVMSR
jgi:hypothetical protein